MSVAKKGQPLSPSHIQNISLGKSGDKHWNYGKTLSEETKKKIALANTGKSYNKGIPSPKKMKIEILDMENNVVKTFDSQLEMLRGLKVGYPRGQALLKGEELFIDTNNLLKAEEGKPREYKCRKV